MSFLVLLLQLSLDSSQAISSVGCTVGSPSFHLFKLSHRSVLMSEMDELLFSYSSRVFKTPHPKNCLTAFCAFPVNRIKELHKVTVRIPPDNEKSNLIRIEGDPQGVQEAKKELLELASRMVSRDPIECCHGESQTSEPRSTLSPCRRTSVQRT